MNAGDPFAQPEAATPSAFTPELGAAIAARRADILARMSRAAQAAGRDPGAVRLAAVAKRQDGPRVSAMLAAGQRLFAENRVQEAAARWRGARTMWPDLGLRLIGPLQTNKVREAVALFDAIETLDREKLARAIADGVQAAGRQPELLVQVNIGAEPQKSGVAIAEADAFIAAIGRDYGLAVTGLMAIPPAAVEPAPYFALLAKIAARNGLATLSMGMSGDFERAIAFGATIVRIGSALFGERTAPLNELEGGGG